MMKFYSVLFAGMLINSTLLAAATEVPEPQQYDAKTAWITNTYNSIIGNRDDVMAHTFISLSRTPEGQYQIAAIQANPCE